ncbi:SDR family NAD(P)-dependent oxidoreductase, partial [Micromonospora arborensis]|uniref:type I polyketide synthase n=1 Tax=Micromonospora arborensis TaxID=2116518 RepID=UPI0033D41E22
GEADQAGRRPVSIHSHPDDTEDWTQHATGTLATTNTNAGTLPDASGIEAWPPVDASIVDLSGHYEAVAQAGYGYGPTFQGLRAAWRRGDEIFAEVVLPEPERDHAGQFGIHPALLDAATHPLGLPGIFGSDQLWLPFAWTGVSLLASRATSVRVQLSPTGTDTVAVTIVDGAGRIVLKADSLAMRPASAQQLERKRGSANGPLLALEWTTVPGTSTATTGRWAVLGEDPMRVASALIAADMAVDSYADLAATNTAVDNGAPLPDLLLLAATDHPGLTHNTASVTQAVHHGVAQTLATIQAWLAEDRWASSRLIVLTHEAVSTSANEPISDLVGASAWGLIRSAQTEHPNRIVLVDLDVDGLDSSVRALPAVLASNQPQVAIRQGQIRTPRLAPIRDVPDTETLVLPPTGTVLVTGGTGQLGGLVARHLVTKYGVRRLILTSRRGMQASGSPALVAELSELGAEVSVIACDVADHNALAQLLSTIPTQHPLTAVVHAAGVLADGVVESMTRQQLETVLRPKVDAAVNLHELTRNIDLRLFVLFSSAAGILGGPGQGNYAAANAFLDAVAMQRQAQGLPGTSIAWGLWEQASGMTAHLQQSDLARVSRSGVTAMSTEQALALFDAAVGTGEPLLVAARWDTGRLQAQAEAGTIPAMLRGLARAPSRPQAASAADASALVRRLTGLPEQDQQRTLLELVRSQVATVLGHSSADGVDVTQAFKDLGFDSLTAVEFRNRLGTATGLRLPATLVFDYPTPTALATHLRTQVLGTHPKPVAEPPRTASANDDLIAIVGVGCRFPGGVRSAEDLWRLVVTGGDGIS